MRTGDLTTLENAQQWLGLSGLQISDITPGSPTIVTLTTRPTTVQLISGLPYSILGVIGMTGVNDTHIVTVLSPTTFSIPVDTTAQTYGGGGFVDVSVPLVERLISATSAFIQNWLNRTIAATAYSQMFNGQDMPTMVVTQTPLLAINALNVGGMAIAARAPLSSDSVTVNQGYGYTFDPDTGQIALTGALFPRGFNNVTVDYVAGYMIANEAQTIPASAPYDLYTMTRWSAGDRGVTYADGTPMVAVAANPQQGEYVADWSLYTFNAADAGQGVLISYAMVPFDVEQACIDTMGDWFKYRERIGVTSKSIEGQSVGYNFTNTGIPVRAKSVLDQYKRVVPGWR